MAASAEQSTLEKLKNWVNTWRRRLYLDAHHDIQRHAVMVIAVMTILFVFMAAMFTAAKIRTSAEMNNKSVYVSSFTTSKTQVSGQIEDLYVSPDKSRAMVMMKFEDISKVSTQAETYQAFASAVALDFKAQPWKSQPKGSIYVFGSTGYMAVMLDNHGEEFPSQIMELTMRGNNELKTTDGAGADEAGADGSDAGDQMQNDGSFSQFDQWRTYINPGAQGTKVTDSISGETPDAKRIFNDLVVKKQEAATREKLNKQLEGMANDLNAIDEYRTRLTATRIDGVAVKVPAAPKQIVGDTVMCGDTPMPELQKKSKPCEDDRSLSTKWTFPEGFNFDWAAGSVEDGYLDKLVPKGQTAVQYLSKKSSDDSSESSFIAGDESSWRLANGQKVDDLDDSLSSVKAMNESISLYSNAMQTYYTDKRAYQVQGLSELLNLELSLRDVDSNVSVNDEAKALRLY